LFSAVVVLESAPFELEQEAKIKPVPITKKRSFINIRFFV
jgi:hypothetical protein